MADLIQEKDSLNRGRIKLNKAIIDANDAKNIAEQADDKATQALANSESTQTQLDQIVIEGDSSVEAAQARVGTDNHTYGTLKERLDSEHLKLAVEKASIFLSSTEPSETDENTYWYEDLGEAPIEFDTSEIMVANAVLGSEAPENIENFWFKS